MSGWEGAAVVLAIVYLALAIRQNLWCWAAAFASTSIYLVLMYAALLYMESVLQVFYLGMAVYGWYHWRHGPDPDHALPVKTWSVATHVRVIAGVFALAGLSGALLGRYSDAALPYLDSFTTWGAVVTTWMVARKILENWLYWFVIDSVSIYLYVSRELYLTALLFAFYLVLIVIGYIAWRREMYGGEAEAA
ncbi:MAG: nicotinamide riboside transporter PnuC [Gammaproteobacteria bacterium]|nr:MAG: nicotinamide riboside transporter PnuC [Gammaproteobacteria bacterium]